MDPADKILEKELSEYQDVVDSISQLKPKNIAPPSELDFETLYKRSHSAEVIHLKRKIFSLLTAAAVIVAVIIAPDFLVRKSLNETTLVQLINNEVLAIEDDLAGMENLYLVENDYLAEEINDNWQELSGLIYREV